mmetsp:Transcript_64290/g.158210  ORF Transcript_64290/g.158210 Transcript_64290/m.158210 type:complete len:113 (-) Transcript_64290:109-447(-)
MCGKSKLVNEWTEMDVKKQWAALNENIHTLITKLLPSAPDPNITGGGRSKIGAYINKSTNLISVMSALIDKHLAGASGSGGGGKTGQRPLRTRTPPPIIAGTRERSAASCAP